MLNAVAARVPWLVGGAADLAPSTKTLLTFEGAGHFGPQEWVGRNLHFGVREHAAGCIANGLSLSKVRPYQAGFLIFSDFQRGAIRLSALMELPVIHVFTHDSIGVGEDGPTHQQPVEQIVSLRAVPGLVDIRPADANEVAEAWRWFMPRRHDIYTVEHLRAVDDEINHRPRAVLDAHTPEELFATLLASPGPSTLRR